MVGFPGTLVEKKKVKGESSSKEEGGGWMDGRPFSSRVAFDVHGIDRFEGRSWRIKLFGGDSTRMMLVGGSKLDRANDRV